MKSSYFSDEDHLVNNKILIVDDHDGIRDSIHRILTRIGYRACAVGLAEDAIDELQKENWDLILIDLQLPQMDGMSLIHWIRENKIDIDIIVITANPSLYTMSEAMNLDVQNYLMKPWTKEVLLSSIQNALDKKKLKSKLKSTIKELQANKANFVNIVEKMPDGIIILSSTMQVEYANTTAIKILQYTSERQLLKRISNIALGKSTSKEISLYTTKGAPIVLEIRSEPTQWQEKQAHLLIIRNITLRKRIEKALIKSEERYTLTAQSTNDGLWDWNLATDKINYSLRWKEMIGFADDELGFSPEEWFSRIHPEHKEPFQAILQRHKEQQTPFFEAEYQLLHRDGEYRWMLCRGLSARDKNGKVHRIVGSQIDLTLQKDTEKQIEQGKHHDELTGLGNRSWFIENLQIAIEKHKTDSTYTFALFYLDIDRFKLINDSLGHHVGDQLLSHIALNLKELLRPEDSIGRLGGDEFAIIINFLRTSKDIIPVVERLQKELENAFVIGSHELFISASIGITLGHTFYTHASEMIRHAEIAMYQAKSLGRGQYAIYTEQMLKKAGLDTNTVKEFNLEHDLRNALQRKELELYYQPIVLLEDARILGFEALIRWNHPTKGLISPIKFIPMAEEIGLIIPIGTWVLQQACRQLKKWQEIFSKEVPLYMSVNVSAKQFFHEGFVEIVQETLEQTKLDAQYLKLEITESILMKDPDYMRTLLLELKSLGLSLSMDDFGTGYSSLSYLHQFPIDILKVDRSFVSGMDQKDQREIVKTIVALALNLDKDVIAEGVETKAHVKQLSSFGCVYGQGYLFSRPLNSEKAQQLLEKLPSTLQNSSPLPN